MSSRQNVFQLRDVEFKYPGMGKPAIAGVNLHITRCAFHAIIGPNGSGKSTLLRLMLGTLQPRRGSIAFAGRPLAQWPRRELARRIGAVPQHEEFNFPLAARDLVGMGRYPHLGPWQTEGEADRQAIEDAMRRCNVLELAQRRMSTLSGGERQRVRIARALAQQPQTLLLDEPTAALDIRHEMQVFELLRRLAREHVNVVVVTHNLNLAARYANRLILLDRGGIATTGTAAEVLRHRTIQTVYHWPVTVIAHPGPGPDARTPQVVPLACPEAGTSASPRNNEDAP